MFELHQLALFDSQIILQPLYYDGIGLTDFFLPFILMKKETPFIISCNIYITFTLKYFNYLIINVMIKWLSLMA